MKKLVSIKREKTEILGLVEFLDSGLTKYARFPKSWSDEKVCEVFGIDRSSTKESRK